LDFWQSLDVSVFFFINRNLANPIFDVLCIWFRNKWTWIPVYLLLAFLLYSRFHFRAIAIIIFAGVVILLSDQISASVIKPLFERLRPCNDPDVRSQVRLLVACGSGFSFVSSHATNHFALSSFLWKFFKERNSRLLLMLWACAVAFSQVYVGVHYPGDVVAGGICGAGIGFAVAELLQVLFNPT
jgi:undecaprenyl-diphosphatase